MENIKNNGKKSIVIKNVKNQKKRLKFEFMLKIKKIYSGLKDNFFDSKSGTDFLDFLQGDPQSQNERSLNSFQIKGTYTLTSN